MGKKNKITAADIMKAMKIEDEKKITITCGMNEDTIEVAIKPRLSLRERENMIQDILDLVFLTDIDGVVRYHPSLRKFAFEYEIVNYFTEISLPTNSEKTWDFLENTRIASRIVGAVRDNYIGEIIAEANELIEYRKEELLKKSKFDQVFNELLGILDMVRQKADETDLSEIIAYVQENSPELKEKLDTILRRELDTITEDA